MSQPDSTKKSTMSAWFLLVAWSKGVPSNYAQREDRQMTAGDFKSSNVVVGDETVEVAMLVPDNGLDRVQISLVSSPRQLEGVETEKSKERRKGKKG